MFITGAKTEQFQHLSERLVEKVALSEIKGLPDSIQLNLHVGYSIQTSDDQSWQLLLQQAEQKLTQTKPTDQALDQRNDKNIIFDRFGFIA